MNVESVHDDEDFPVFKAGPPIPIRTKPSKTHSRKSKSIPLKATASPSSTALLMAGSDNLANTSVSKTESKVKKYIEKVKASDEVGRKKRVKPERMLSLEDLYQVGNVVNCSSVTANPNNKICERKSEPKQSQASDLQVAPKNAELAINEVQDKLRETLRIVKEKDELINKLRESCHDLAIKCADAENRVDELRFSYGRLPSSASSVCVGGVSNSRQNKKVDNSNDPKTNQQRQYSSSVNLRRCSSDEGLHSYGVEDKEKLTSDKGTTTKDAPTAKHDVQTQIENDFCQIGLDKDGAGLIQEVGLWQADDEILQETCSNWMEKVQNWKTDSNFNLSQDSGGDRDSGFRGSAEIDMDSVRRQQRHSSLPRSRRKCQEHNHADKLLKVPSRMHSSQMSSLPTTTTTIPAVIPPTFNQEDRPQNATPVYDEMVAMEHNQQHFWPSFSSSHSNLNLLHHQSEHLPSNSTKAKSLFYEMAEADRNKCTYFQEKGCCLIKHHHHRTLHHYHHHLCGAKSLDSLYFSQQNSHPTQEELRSLIDTSLEPPETILKSHLNAQHRSMEKRIKILDPLLNDTTKIALRVKRKSERLAKMLQDACNFE